MTEKELIGKIRELRQIQPKKDWVILTKSQILGDVEVSPKPFLFFRPAYAGLIGLIVIFGLFALVQNSLPGDFLYPIRKITEESQAFFLSEEERPAFQLKLANERLEDLTKVPAKNLSPALNEFQTQISQAAKKIAKTKNPDVKEIIEETKKFQENREKIEALGIVVGETEELKNALAKLVEREIRDLENRTLTEEQKEILFLAKENFEAGNYSQALEKLLILSQ